MERRECETRYELAAAILPSRLRRIAMELPETDKRRAEEFRLRAGHCLSVLLPEGERSLEAIVTTEELETLCDIAAEFSRYASIETLRQGFLPVRGGFRVGLCGSAVVKDGEPWFVAKDVCDALEKDDYETVGQKMYETHHGMSKLYEVSCEELDFLNDCAKEYGVTGSRVMGGGFGGCTINLVKNELYDNFVEKTKEAFKAKFGRSPKVYDVVIGDGSRKVE